MKDFCTELLREKFVISTPQSQTQDGVIALSNRVVAPLQNRTGTVQETLVIRSHNMHCAVRMTARILQAFKAGGPLTTRALSYDWETVWHSILNDYETLYNPQCWIAIYHAGKCIFSAGEHHPLLDMIEKCDEDNESTYDFSISLAEELFRQTGKDFKIVHNSNVALSVHFENNQGRCGIILRSPLRTTTFTFTAQPKDEMPLNIPQCLGTCAAFLEGVQLAFQMGMNTEKIRLGLIERFSREEKQTREGKQRLTRLNDEILTLEKTFKIHYRPEKPEFHHIMMDAERLGQQVLKLPEKREERDEPDQKN